MRVSVFNFLKPPPRMAGVATLIAATLAVVIALVMFVLPSGVKADAPASVTPLSMEMVAPGVYVHTGVHEDPSPGNQGDIANIGFIVGASGVAVIDSGDNPALGRRLRAAIRKVTDLPILYVVNTHMHPDHVLGNAAFKADDPEYIGHVRLAAALADREAFYLKALETQLGEELAFGAEIIPPTRTVGIGVPVEIDLGGRVLVLTAYPTAHTDNDLTVLDRLTGTLWAGDLIFIDRIPSLDGSLTGWIEVLDELRSVEAARLVPGHGPASAEWPQAASGTARYLKILAGDIRAILARNGSLQEAASSAGQGEKGNWVLFDEYNGGNATAGYVELEWE